MEERCQCGVWDENCEHCNHRDTEITRLTAELEKKDGYIEDLEGTIDSLRDEMDYPKRYDKDGFPDDDGCYADAYETTDKITRLTAEIAVLREDKARWRSAHVELCAAIARMPTDVRWRDRHFSTDETHRGPLIDLFYRQRADIDAKEE